MNEDSSEICSRGHDTSTHGFYTHTKLQHKHGKTYKYSAKRCKLCHREDSAKSFKRKMEREKKMRKLPARRPGFTEYIFHSDSQGNRVKQLITINVDPSSGQVMEVFAANMMTGSDMEALLTDGCILISLCLQAGITLQELKTKLGMRRQYNEPDSECPPTSILGSIVRAAKEVNDEMNEEGKADGLRKK